MSIEPDITATFEGGPNDGKGIPLYGSPSRRIDTGQGGGHYELDMLVWGKKGIALYTWHPEEEEA